MKNLKQVLMHKASTFNAAQLSFPTFLMLLLCSLSNFTVQAQFIPTTTPETTYPTTTFTPMAAAIPGLYASSKESTVFGGAPGGGNYLPEITAWTEPNGTWEDGTFTYGYTDNSGTYTAVGTQTIPGAKHLSAAYMESGGNAFIIAAYTVQIPTYAELDPINRPCVWTLTGAEYAHEYQIFNWPSPTSTISFNNVGRVSSLLPVNYPSCHPLFGPSPNAYPDFACDGTIVMDVNHDKNRVAFSWTGNCGAVQCTAGDLSSTGLLTKNIDLLAIFPAANPVDVAFRRDPSSGLDYIHTLIPDGDPNTFGMGYFVVQDDWTEVFLGTASTSGLRRTDDASIIGSSLTGTLLTGGMVDHVKLDVPDVSVERRWAYTWSNGTNIYLRRYATAFSSDPNTPMNTSTTEALNDGTLAASVAPFSVAACNGFANELPAISYTQDVITGNNKQQLVWRTRANTTTGTDNWVGIEVEEIAPWPAPVTAVTALDYLEVQSTNTNRATDYIALSHCSAIPYLYTSFMQNDNMGINYLNHKNHDFTVNSFWRKSNNELGTIAEEEIVKVGPNPFTQELSIRSNVALQVQLTDITGRTLGNFSGEEAHLNTQLNRVIQSLSSGTYLLQTNSDSGQKNIFKLNKL